MPVADVRDTVEDAVTSRFAVWELDERGLVFVEQNSLDTAVEQIGGIHRDCR
jgi:hypothetical protein